MSRDELAMNDPEILGEMTASILKTIIDIGHISEPAIDMPHIQRLYLNQEPLMRLFLTPESVIRLQGQYLPFYSRGWFTNELPHSDPLLAEAGAHTRFFSPMTGPLGWDAGPFRLVVSHICIPKDLYSPASGTHPSHIRRLAETCRRYRHDYLESMSNFCNSGLPLTRELLIKNEMLRIENAGLQNKNYTHVKVALTREKYSLITKQEIDLQRIPRMWDR